MPSKGGDGSGPVVQGAAVYRRGRPAGCLGADKPRSPKTLLDWARQVALQIHRWLPGRRIVIVGDTAFASVDFLGAVRNHVSVLTRLRLDANLYAPRRPGDRAADDQR